MGSFSDFLELELLDHVFGKAAYSAPATLHVGLSTADPTDDASGIAEPSGGSYARVAVTNNDTNFPNAGAGHKHNGADITFTTAGASWGTVTAFGLFDSAIGGANNLLYWAELSVDKTIGAGDTAKFAAGDLTFSED